jgi:ubiquinone biosynthesis protein
LKRFPELAENFPEIPTLLFQALDSAAKTNNQLTTHNRELAQLRHNMESQHTTTLIAITLGSLLVSLAILFQ